MAEGSEKPDPDRIADLADFTAELGRLRLWAGSPPFRALAAKVGPLLPEPRTVAASTVIDVFKPQRRRLDFDLVLAIVRALGLSETDVDRWRAACLRVHAEAKSGGPTGVLRQLPADPATFVGRDKDLHELMETAVSSGGSPRSPTVVVSAIEGMGGVGKTQLAVRAAHRLTRAGRFTDVQLYVNLRGFDPDRAPADPADVLDGFLRALDVPGQHIPAGLDERASMFRDRLFDRQALILLDDAADENQVRPLIPSGPGCLVVITSRRSLAGLDGASLHVLDAFATPEAVELLAAIAGRERIGAEPEAAARVAELCGGLPLALALAAARLRSRPAWTVADLVSRLADGGVDAVAAGGRSLRPVFDVSYAGLDDAAQRMFRLLGAHPGDDFSVAAAAALAGVGVPAARELLERLQDAYLLQQKSGGRYNLHDLLRAYAGTLLAAAQPDEREAAVTRILGFYLHSADSAEQCFNPVVRPLTSEIPTGSGPLRFAGKDQAIAWCDAELANLAAAQDLAVAAGDHATAWQLPVVLSAYLLMRSRAEDWVSTLTAGLDSARAAADQAGQAAVLGKLGMALAEAGRLPDAVAALRTARELNRARGDRFGEVVNLTNQAVIHELLGQFDQAVFCLQRSLTGKRALGNRAGEPLTLANLGRVHFRLGRHAEAVEYCEQALEIYAETGQEYSMPIARNTIGESYREMGRLAEAEQCHRDALAEARRGGARRVEANSLWQLGRVLRRAGQNRPAAEYLAQARDAYTELGDSLADEVTAELAECLSAAGGAE